MPLILQHGIYRIDLKNNPVNFYVFEDNVIREGFGGQAKEMRGEPNAIGIATKWSPGTEKDDYFSDRNFKEQTDILMVDFDRVFEVLEAGGTVIWPSNGIGTGLSQVPQRAPKTWAFMLKIQEKMMEFRQPSCVPK